MNTEKYEVARITDIDKDHPKIDFHGGRGNGGLGYYSSIKEAKEFIKNYKNNHPSESWPFIIIYFENKKGKLVYVEYQDYCLEQFTHGRSSI